MSSYVNKKTRVFRTIKDVRLEPRRSNGRMKTYPSAIDARAWCGIREDRRQHILEILKYGYGDKFKLLPYDLLIKFLIEKERTSSGVDNEDKLQEIKQKDDQEGMSDKAAMKPEEIDGKDEEIVSVVGPGGEGSFEKLPKKPAQVESSDTTGALESRSSTVNEEPLKGKYMKDFCICVKMQSPRGVSPTITSATDSSVFLEACDGCPKSGHTMEHQCTVTEELKKACEDVCPLKKIQELENKLVLKRKRTKQKIDLLKCTLDRFKRELELERDRNNNLIRRYCNQTKAVEFMQAEIKNVRKESFHDKRKLGQINSTLKKILTENAEICKNVERDSSSATCNDSCKQPVKRKTPPRRRLPHFHAEISFMNLESRYKHKCTMNKSPSPCVIKVRGSGCSLGIEE